MFSKPTDSHCLCSQFPRPCPHVIVPREVAYDRYCTILVNIFNGEFRVPAGVPRLTMKYNFPHPSAREGKEEDFHPNEGRPGCGVKGGKIDEHPTTSIVLKKGETGARRDYRIAGSSPRVGTTPTTPRGPAAAPRVSFCSMSVVCL